MTHVKISLLAASVVSAVVAFLLLRRAGRRSEVVPRGPATEPT